MIPTKTKRAQCVPAKEANDYRYFPDPDRFTGAYWYRNFWTNQNAMPVPVARREQFSIGAGLPDR